MVRTQPISYLGTCKFQKQMDSNDVYRFLANCFAFCNLLSFQYLYNIPT